MGKDTVVRRPVLLLQHETMEKNAMNATFKRYVLAVIMGLLADCATFAVRASDGSNHATALSAALHIPRVQFLD